MHLAGGAELVADSVLVATGVRSRRLPGVEGDRVVHLRDLDDADRLRTLLPGAERIAMIGAGLIGSEVAASARDLGVEVTCLEAADLPLLRQLGPEMAQVYADLHRENGVDLRFGRQVESVVQTAAGVVVRTGSGDVVEADLLVVAVGAVPNDEFARASGLPIDPDGRRRPRRRRVPHRQSRACSRRGTSPADSTRPPGGTSASSTPTTPAGRGRWWQSAAGAAAAHRGPAWFWSDQYELGLQFVGHAARLDRGGAGQRGRPRLHRLLPA